MNNTNTNNKLPLSQILIARQAFNRIPNINSLEISSRLAWRIIKFLNQTQEFEEFYTQRLRAIVQDCAEKDENEQIIYTEEGVGFKIKADKQAVFGSSMMELESMPVEAPDIRFTEDEIFAVLPKISIPQMNALMAFIQEENKNEKDN